ncbi:asparagine synthase (glutamine-hydrolysing) [Lysobacter sp. yr284]|uniref:asparagine synthase (glutamine-hydrolyzing) n=1 Tax=Lysobacter sp. yr284 TaxID=1761791 RepID=UPI00089C8B3A|nr:asparagine synthase (glutamine-hydrolyzing) [Lysobacter sp. yr284]SDY57362.1 asparagine synthase (glutamine-hydrolysing) [Lysobacter sp. yr284]
MCGIAGWIDWRRDLRGERATVAAMTARLGARGPDGHGEWAAGHAAFGHRRLAVIDPSDNGAQPMLYRRDGRAWAVVYNGEIYNHRELRAQLQARGHRFVSDCDTEALLLAYVEWGEACVERLDGIFAFAIWDEQAQTLFMARDPLGVKPLFWARVGEGLAFASEIKALLEHPGIPAEVDERGLTELVLTRPVFPSTPGITPFAGIEELRGGRCLRADRHGLRERDYWRLHSAPHPHDLATTVERVRELLGGIVERQLVSDVAVGCILSGGLDSSAVTALAAPLLRAHGGTLNTWCIDLADSEHFAPHAFISSRDAPYAAEAAAYVGTRHRTVTMDTQAMSEHLLAAMRARDLPVALQVDTSLLLLMRALKPQATVVLSGEGADEVFGGYGWMAPQSRLPTFPWTPDAHDGAWPFYFRQDVIARARPAERVRQTFADTLAEVPRLDGEDAHDAQHRALSYLALRRWLPDLLDRNDRVSMAAGVEARVPFCDKELVQYLWNVPFSIKSAGGIEKGVLRRAVGHVLPPSIAQRRKSAFPQFEHGAYYRSLIERVRDIFASGGAAVRDLYDERRIGELCAGTVPAAGWLFGAPYAIVQLERVVMTDAWLREYRVSLR